MIMNDDIVCKLLDEVREAKSQILEAEESRARKLDDLKRLSERCAGPGSCSARSLPMRRSAAWWRRTKTNLRRVKLEALLTAMHNCEAHLAGLRNSSLAGKSLDERDPLDELEVIA
jgi:hypothetical protein